MAALTTKQRKALPATSYALPGKKAYPIDTAARARDALGKASQFATGPEKSEIVAAVHRKYPEMDIAAERKKNKKS